MNPEQFEIFMKELANQRQELKMIRQELLKVIIYMQDAEKEVPERVRRFANYFHDIHDVQFMYEEVGVAVPEYIHREVERLHDRYRQILKELNSEGNAFEKVRREMASDPENKYDHQRLLNHWKEKANEAGKSQ